MPYLGDYLGHLLSEITTARVQADLETVRVAELYAGHPLLKHLPVPHFRMPTVTLDVPVAVQQMEVAKPGDPPRGGVAAPVMRKRIDPLVDAELHAQAIVLSSAERAAVKRSLDQAVAGLSQPSEVAGDVTFAADRLTTAAADALRALRRKLPIEPDRLDRFATALKAAARADFLSQRTPPPRLNVLVTTAELREAGPREILARLQLTISEEAVEWSVVESQGSSYEKLTPE